MSNADDLLAQMRRLDPGFVEKLATEDADIARRAMEPAAKRKTDTRAALDAALDAWGAAEIYAANGGHERADVDVANAKRAALDAAITAHVEAEVARRLAAAPEVEEALGEVWSECEHDGRCGKSMADDDHAAARCARCVADGLDRCWCRCAPAARQPCAGWSTAIGTTMKLAGGGFTLAYAWFAADCWEWKVAGAVASGDAPTLIAAQLAAEDALLAVADEIRRAEDALLAVADEIRRAVGR